MTTIAWDGVTLASDKRANLDGSRLTVTKIRRGRSGNLVGVSGTFALAEDVFAWLCNGGLRPIGQATDRVWCPTIEITKDGQIYRHEQWGRFLIEDRFYAVGSGADFARAAMALGKTAVEAVELASRFDTSTGDGIDLLALQPLPRAAAKAARRSPATSPAPRSRARQDRVH
jgi:20S proteasome alpha/beta subunit